MVALICQGGMVLAAYDDEGNLLEDPTIFDVDELRPDGASETEIKENERSWGSRALMYPRSRLREDLLSWLAD